MNNHNYALSSQVPVERTKGQIRGLLAQIGADGFGELEQSGRVQLIFCIRKVNYKIAFDLPRMADYAHTSSGRDRCQREQVQHHERALRSYWRTILLIVKANAEAVALGVLTTEQAFGAMMMLGNGRTVGEAVATMAIEGKTPAALPLLT